MEKFQKQSIVTEGAYTKSHMLNVKYYAMSTLITNTRPIINSHRRKRCFDSEEKKYLKLFCDILCVYIYIYISLLRLQSFKGRDGTIYR